MNQYKTTPADHWLMGGMFGMAINTLTVICKYAAVRYPSRHPVMRKLADLRKAIDGVRYALEDAAAIDHPDAVSTLMYFRGGHPAIQEDITEWWTEAQAVKLSGISPEELHGHAVSGEISTLPTGNGRIYRPADLVAIAERS